MIFLKFVMLVQKSSPVCISYIYFKGKIFRLMLFTVTILNYNLKCLCSVLHSNFIMFVSNIYKFGEENN